MGPQNPVFSRFTNKCLEFWGLVTTPSIARWGPKGGPMEPKEGPKERNPKKSPYSLMDHQWIHWWKSIDIHWWKSIDIHWWLSINEYRWISSSLKSSSLKKPWKNYAKQYKNHEKTMKDYDKLWKTMKSRFTNKCLEGCCSYGWVLAVLRIAEVHATHGSHPWQ